MRNNFENETLLDDEKVFSNNLGILVFANIALMKEDLKSVSGNRVLQVIVLSLSMFKMVETLIITKIMEALEITGIERVEEAIIMGEVATSTTITTEVEDITITTLARTTTINTRKMGKCFFYIVCLG